MSARDQDAKANAAMMVQARSVACPVLGCHAGTDGTPPHECRDVPESKQPWEYGVHAARARAAGLPPLPRGTSGAPARARVRR